MNTKFRSGVPHSSHKMLDYPVMLPIVDIRVAMTFLQRKVSVP